MDRFIIEGEKRLSGEVEVGSAKNAILPMMAASIIADGTTCLHNIPKIRDVTLFCNLLSHLGASIEYENRSLKIDTSKIREPSAPYSLVKQMRASFLVAGPLLAKFSYAKVSLPGGCAIGTRRIDIHLKGFSALGAEIEQRGGYIILKGKLKGAKVYLDYPTHTGTENIMMTAVLAEGETVIENAALEPEIVDLADLLNKMGAMIEGAGTPSIKIIGVRELSSCAHSPIPDRIEAATFLIAGAITGGSVMVKNAPVSFLSALISKLSEMGVRIDEKGGGIFVSSEKRTGPTDIITAPYPGFATDLQPQIAPLLCLSSGRSSIRETVFDNRFLYAQELVRMGAKIEFAGDELIIDGVSSLSGADVMAPDIRGGAALVLAGLAAEGETVVHRVYHIDRGYERLEEKLRRLGAKIERVR
jgi:UDP-N-acetylglucosamine 1-carboxyvinyltransferase